MTQRMTEQNNRRSENFSEKSTLEMLQIINEEDKTIALAVEKSLPAIAKAADLAVTNLRKGGRMFYVGAGTSGRLGIVDAGELPCTFGVEHDTVQAIIAGGPTAVYDAAMGDEDDKECGESEMTQRSVGSSDVIVGITASGRTPYVLGAIEAGKRLGAVTIGICNNSDSPLAKAADVAIVADTGPEVIEGSTRMKAGTSQKMILNMLSTVIMSQLGYVYKNYMVRMVPNNEKLYARAIHITSKCTGEDESTCEKVLKESGWKIDEAIVMLACGVDNQNASRLLEENQHVVGKVLKVNGEK